MTHSQTRPRRTALSDCRFDTMATVRLFPTPTAGDDYSAQGTSRSLPMIDQTLADASDFFDDTQS